MYFFAILFLIMALVFFSGKGKGLIAGYNTASDEEKAKYDEKKLNRTYAVFCLILSVSFVLTGIIDKPQAIYFFVNTGCYFMRYFACCSFKYILQKI